MVYQVLAVPLASQSKPVTNTVINITFVEVKIKFREVQ